MVELTLAQHYAILNVFSFTIGATGIAAVFFFVKRFDVLPRYRTGVTLLCLVSLSAAYNYTRLLASFRESFAVVNGAVQATGIPYDDVYRHADWLLTVPMLLISLVLVMDLPVRQARIRGFVLGMLAVEMVVLGYPGKIAATNEARWLWWTVAMVPFLVIIHQLFFGLRSAIRTEPPASRRLISIARLLTVVTWSVYPVLYVLPLFGLFGPHTFVGTQLAYAVADTVAKAGYGLILYRVAQVKSDAAASPAGIVVPITDARGAAARAGGTAPA